MKSKVLKPGFVLALIVGVLLTVAFLFLPNHPDGRHQENEFIVEPFVAGTPLLLCADVYTLDAPNPEYIWTELTDIELIERLTANNKDIQIQFVGTTLSGNNHYLISIYNQDRMSNDYYAFISYGSEVVEKKNLNRYTLGSLSTTFYASNRRRVDRKVLFPSIVLEDAEIPFLQLVAGETYPLLLMQGDSFATSVDVIDYINDFYSKSGWYKVSVSESEKLVISLADGMTSSTIDKFGLYEQAFEITISETESGFKLAIK